jgi:hypothetical protein
MRKFYVTKSPKVGPLLIFFISLEGTLYLSMVITREGRGRQHPFGAFTLTTNQCCGSVRSVCFWAFWIRIRILYHQANIVRNPLIPTVMLLFFDFLSLKNDVNVPSKSNKQKNFYPEPNPDPLVRGMDPRIRIHTKMSWIRNTDQHIPVSSVRLELDAALCAGVALLHEAHFRADVEQEPPVPRLQVPVLLAQRVQPRSHTPPAYPGRKK